MNPRDIDDCINQIQERIDTCSATWMSQFSQKIQTNEKFVDEINQEIPSIMNPDEIEKISRIRQEIMDRLQSIDGGLSEMETLCDELEEIHDEIEVKMKLNKTYMKL